MSQPTGPIQSIERSAAVDRSDVTLPLAWLETGNGGPDLAGGRSGSAFAPAKAALRGFEAVDKGAASIILFGGAGADDIGRLESMLRIASSRDSRTYVVASSDNFSPKDASRLARDVGGRILFRRLSGVPCTALLCARGDRGGVFLGHGAAAQWWMALTKKQGAALFRAALHLFWHEASDEGWLEDKSVTFRPPLDRPFDAPAPSRLDAVRFADVSSVTIGDQVYRPDAGADGLASASTIVVPPDSAHADLLARHLDRGVRVFWSDLRLPAFSLAIEDSWLALGAGERSLVVMLSDQQRNSLSVLVTSAGSAPDWRLARAASLGSIGHRAWLPGAKGPSAIDDDVRTACGSVVADTIRSMPDTEPAKRPDPPTLGRKVTWTWQVLPPRLPGKSKPDPLIAQWADIDRGFEKRCATLAKSLEQVEAHQSTLGRTFSRLKSALMGLGRAHGRFGSTLERLERSVPSALGPARAPGLLDELAKLEEAVDKHKGEVKKAEERARLEEEEEKQRRAYEASQAEARGSLEDAEARLETARSELAEGEAALEDLEANASELAKDERRARRQKLKADKAKAEKQIRIAESAARRARETLAKGFVFEPPKSTGVHPKHKKGKGPRFVPQTSAVIQVPNEALPAVGALRVVGKVRYLAIGDWSELDIGESEAERLGARLVATAGDK